MQCAWTYARHRPACMQDHALSYSLSSLPCAFRKVKGVQLSWLGVHRCGSCLYMGPEHVRATGTAGSRHVCLPAGGPPALWAVPPYRLPGDHCSEPAGQLYPAHVAAQPLLPLLPQLPLWTLSFGLLCLVSLICVSGHHCRFWQLMIRSALRHGMQVRGGGLDAEHVVAVNSGYVHWVALTRGKTQ